MDRNLLVGTSVSTDGMIYVDGSTFGGKYLLTEFLGEGAEFVVYRAVRLHGSDVIDRNEVYKLAKPNAVLEMRTLNYRHRVHRELYPDHPLLMSSAERMELLKDEMTERAKDEHLIFRIEVYRKLLQKTIAVMRHTGMEIFRSGQPLADWMETVPFRPLIDQNLVYHLDNLLDEGRLADEDRPFFEAVYEEIQAAIARWQMQARFTPLSRNPLFNLIGLRSEHFIDDSELLLISQSPECSSLLTADHLDEIFKLVEILYNHTLSVLPEPRRRDKTSEPELTPAQRGLIETMASACRLLSRLPASFGDAPKTSIGRAYVWLGRVLLLDSSQDEAAKQAARSALGEPLSQPNRHDVLLTLAFACYKTNPDEAAQFWAEAQELKARLLPQHPAETPTSVTQSREKLSPKPSASAPRSPGRIEVHPVYSIFAPGQEIFLDELDMSPDLAHVFSAGHSLAGAHVAGIVHGDLHAGHVLTELSSGVSSLIDLSPFDDRTDLDPARMARDFIIAAEHQGADWTKALLSGYLRTSRLIIEDVQPGYCDTLLDILGGQVCSESRAAEPVLSGSTLDRLLGKSILVTPDGIGIHWHQCPMSTAELAYTICGLLISGLNCEPLISPLADGEPYAQAISSLLTQIYHPERPVQNEPYPSLPSAVTGLFQNLRANPRPIPQMQWPIEPLYPALKHLAASEGPGTFEFTSAISDVCDWLAKRSDVIAPGNDPRFASSLRFAQLSFLLMQNKRWPIRALEAQELKVTSRHRHLAWYPALFSSTPYDSAYPYFFTYTSSRIMLGLLMYRCSERRLPSADWRTLDWARGQLSSILKSLADEAVPLDSVARRQALEISTRQVITAELETLTGPWAAHILVDQASGKGPDRYAEGRRLAELVDMIQNAQQSLASLARHPITQQVVNDLARSTSWGYDRRIARGKTSQPVSDS